MRSHILKINLFLLILWTVFLSSEFAALNWGTGVEGKKCSDLILLTYINYVI